MLNKKKYDKNTQSVDIRKMAPPAKRHFTRENAATPQEKGR
jgi:hypothetical protein